ncbi:MAG: hypothetical protein ABI232_07770 [Jatrophihabitantaceae bacterium]
MDEPATMLTAELGADLPASIIALPEAALARLLDQLHAARQHQAEVVASSVKSAVKGVPLPVRAVVRRALTG